MLGWCTCCCSCWWWWCTVEGSTAAVAEGGTRCQRSSASSSASAFRFRLRAWGLFLALACLRARTPLSFSCLLAFLYCSECGGGEDEIGEQSRKGGEEERKGKVAVDGQEGVESSRVSVALLYLSDCQWVAAPPRSQDRTRTVATATLAAQSLIRQPLSEHII